MPYKVLVIDDSREILTVIKRQLSQKGDYEVLSALSGTEGLHLMKTTPGIDLILLDYQMPRMDGLETLRRLQSQSGVSPPVIMITGSDSTQLVLEFMKNHGDDFIIKPIDFDMLHFKIRQSIQNHQTRVGFRELESHRQKEKEVEQLKSSFITLTGHKLKTPLQGIKGTAEITKLALQDGAPIEKIQEYQDRIIQASDQLSDAISEILRISIFENEQSLELQATSLSKIIDHITDHYYDQLQEKQLEVKVMPSKELPPIYADPQALTQALGEVFQNAIKFTEQGSITISVEKTEKCLILWIVDTGIGISTEKQEQVFERFVTLDRTGQTPGMGMGLYIAKMLVELMEGSIHVISEPGKGSSFSITLPIYSK